MSVPTDAVFSMDRLDVFERPGAKVAPTPSLGVGVHVRFGNGVVVSVQWSPLHYCSNRNILDARRDATLTSHDAEVGIWRHGGDLLDWTSEDTVGARQPYLHVMRLLDLAAADELPEPIPAFGQGEGF